MEGLIVQHTDLVARELAERYARDPSGEVEVWATIAQQREAMVVSLYDIDALSRRLPDQPEHELVEVVQRAIGGIWAQETSHTTLLGSLRRVGGDGGLKYEALVGSVEGRMTRWATERGLLGPAARWLIGFGRATGLAPEFTRHLSVMSFREFCMFSSELEITAAHGYARIVRLLTEMEVAEVTMKYGMSQRYEFAKTLAEERFHAAVFQRLTTWLSPDSERFEAREPQQAVLELRAVAEQFLSVPNVPELHAEPAGPWGGFDTGFDLAQDEGLCVSHGGLGALFRAYGCDLVLADSPIVGG